MVGRTMKRLFYILVMIALLPGVNPILAQEVDFLSDDFYEEDAEEFEVNDPIEPFNRTMFDFNDAAYTWVVEPVATGYSNILPWEFRDCIWNFFHNLQEPVRVINCTLQGRFEEAGHALARFLINSTCGIFGLADPAEHEFNIDLVNASLGETLATWGVGDGFYLVVPLFGSTTLRDFSGDLVDAFAMTPYYIWNDNYMITAAIYTTKEVNRASLHLGEYEALKELSFDPYVALRNGYFQYRKKIRDHSEFKQDLPR